MTEIGGESGHLGVDVNAFGVPGLDASDDHPVSQVMHSRDSGSAIGVPAQSPTCHAERVEGGVVAESFAVLGAEKGILFARSTVVSFPLGGELSQRFQGGGMEGNQPGKASFARSDCDHPAIEVDIAA